MFFIQAMQQTYRIYSQMSHELNTFLTSSTTKDSVCICLLFQSKIIDIATVIIQINKFICYQEKEEEGDKVG